jgi:hypothetical protein
LGVWYKERNTPMMKMMLAAATAAAVTMAVPWFAGSVPAKAEGLKMAQVDVQIGRDRDEKVGRDRDEKIGRDRDENSRRDREDTRRDEGGKNLTIGVGPKGIEVGPKERCKTVTTTVERDGRKETSRERRCD